MVAASPPASTTLELDRSLVRGIAWSGGVKTAAQILSWLSTLIVARLLSPTDYGIAGMAMVYIGFVQIVNEFGLSSAVVQRRDLSDDQIAKLGGLSALLGVSLCIVSVAAAPLVAGFFGQPAVRGVVIVLSSTFVTSAFQVLPRSLLTRELRFRSLAALEGSEAVVVTVVTLTLALLGYGYWSLVIGGIAGRLASTAYALVLRPHRLAWPRPLASIRDAVTFGSHLAISNIAWYVFRSADMTIVGRRLGETALGAYSLGWNLATLPVDRVSSLVARATPAIFARVQNDQAALRRYVITLTEAVSLITLPVAVGMALVADDFVDVVLGATWRPAIMPLRVLALAAVFRSTIPILSQVLVATGQSRRNMQGTIGIAIVLPILFLIASRWGTTGVALVWLFAFPVASILLYLRHALSACGLTLPEYLRALWPAASGSLVMMVTVLATNHLLADVATPLRLGAQILAGAATYASVLYIAHGPRLSAYLATLRLLR